VTGLAEDDNFLEQKDPPKTFLTTVIDAEVGLPQQHALLLEVHLK